MWAGGNPPGSSGADSVSVAAGPGGMVVNLEDAFVRIGTLQVSAAAGGSGQLILTGGSDSFPVFSVGAINASGGTTVVLDEPLTIGAQGLNLNAGGGTGRIEFKGMLSDPFDAALEPTGIGSLTVAGGEVVLKGSMMVSGATEVRAGKLVLAGADGIGGSEVLNLKGGTLTADPYVSAAESAGRTVSSPVSILGDVQIGEAAADVLKLGGNVDLGGGTRTLTVGSTVEISGEISDGGSLAGRLVKVGGGKLVLSAPNSHTGGTELREGILQVTAGDALGGVSGAEGTLTVSGGTFQLGAEQSIGGLEVKGGALVADPDLDPASVGRLVIKGGAITAAVADTAVVAVSLADDPAGPRAALSKTGAGTLTLSGENEYGGGTFLSAGVLVVGSDKALGAGSVWLSGGVLAADGGQREIANTVAVSGSVDFGRSGSGSLLLSGSVLLQGATAVLHTNSDTRISGVVQDGTVAPGSGGRLIKAGAAQLILSGTNSYSGGTELRAGSLVAAADGALGGGSVAVHGGSLHVGATTQTVRALNLTAGAVTGSLGGRFVIQDVGESFVEANVAGTASLSVALEEGSSVVGLRKTGAGVLFLSGASTYRGDTRVEAGTVHLVAGGAGLDGGGAAGALGAARAGAVVLAGGSLLATGAVGGPGVSLEKEVRVLTSGAVIAEGASLAVSKLSVARPGIARVSGDVRAGAVEVKGSLVLSGNSPLQTVTLSSESGASFVWDKPALPGAKGIVITGSAPTDLSAAKLEFSNGFVAGVLAQTGTLNSGGLSSGALLLGNFVTSAGTVTAPGVVAQPDGLVNFKLVSRSGQREIDLVMERKSFQSLLPANAPGGFGAVLDSLGGNELKALLAAIPAGADQKTIQDVLKKADGGSTIAAAATMAPAQALAVSASVDVHLDDLSAPSGSSMSMGVRVGAPSGSASPLMSPEGGGGEADRNWMLWTSGYGAWGRTDADANGNGKTTSRGGGSTLGLERRIGDSLAGFLVSVGESLTQGDHPSYLRARSDSWNVGGYGMVNIGPIVLDASALWGTSIQDIQRDGIGGTATARYGTQNWQTGVGVAANLAPKESSWQVSPVVRLKFINSSEDGFSETGSALNIGSSAHNNSHVLSKLGLRVSKNGQLSPTVQFGIDAAGYWVRDYDSEGRDLQFTLGGRTYTSRTRDRNPDSAQFNLGLQATFSEVIMLRLSGQQDLASDRSQSTGVLTVGWNF